MKMHYLVLFALICVVAAACGDNAKPAAKAAGPDTLVDTSLGAETVADTATATDVQADVPPKYEGKTNCKFEWLQEKAPVDTTRTKFALGLFHYNIEYVIGGLEYTFPDGKKKRFLDIPGNAGYDDDKVQDYIIDQTLRPILEVFERHPKWGVDIEIQGMAIEIMAQRHPKILALLKKLIDNGQVELISFHWAAQLFLAFPREDLHRSHQAVKAAMAQYCLPLGPVVFNQEGQAGEGRQQMLVEGDWKIGVFPKNLWNYQYKVVGGNWAPLYLSEGGLMVVGPGGIDPKYGLDVAWHFFDDGELRAVGQTTFGPFNPYFAPEAPTDPKRVKEYEDSLVALEQKGYFITRIGDYVRHLQAKGIAASPAPQLLDGTWQAPSTQSIRKWLGGNGIVAGPDERDNQVRTGNAVARMHVAAVQRMVDAIAKDFPDPAVAWHAAMTTMWQLLWRAQVSDCSGINPWQGEIQFGLDSNAAILKQAEALRATLLKAQGKKGAEVDLQSGKVTWAVAPMQPDDIALKPVLPPFEVTVTADRPSQVQWFDGGKSRYQLVVALPATACSSCYYNDVTLAMPRFDNVIRYSPGLLETQVRTVPMASMQFSQGEVFLPLANGLLGLGDGWWVIKHVRSVHVAARVPYADLSIGFSDATVGPEAQQWHFTVIKADQALALDLANRINVWPIVRY